MATQNRRIDGAIINNKRVYKAGDEDAFAEFMRGKSVAHLIANKTISGDWSDVETAVARIDGQPLDVTGLTDDSQIQGEPSQLTGESLEPASAELPDDVEGLPPRNNPEEVTGDGSGEQLPPATDAVTAEPDTAPAAEAEAPALRRAPRKRAAKKTKRRK